MQLIKKYEGAVFFVDLLGMSALTRNQITLTDDDFRYWLEPYQLEYNNQHLAAALLARFRQILSELHNEYKKDVIISQLSDCAFFWSKSVSKIVIAAQRFMFKALNEGLLCRGGLSFGEIIETHRDHQLGRFIVGKGVTQAASLESVAKGARVLIDENFPSRLWDHDKKLAEKLQPLFQPFINPLDYSTYDEFKWYLVPELNGGIEDFRVIDKKKRIEFTKSRLKLASEIRASPKFNWNTKSTQGLIQLNATINFMSENDLLNINHNFDWKNVVSKRDDSVVQSINQLIDRDKDYRETGSRKKN